MPVMAPPLKLTLSAVLRLTVAACAVRTLARTETNMPMKPAAPDRMAPIAKPIAVGQPRPGTKAMTRNSTTPTMAMVRYWRLR